MKYSWIAGNIMNLIYYSIFIFADIYEKFKLLYDSFSLLEEKLNLFNQELELDILEELNKNDIIKIFIETTLIPN